MYVTQTGESDIFLWVHWALEENLTDTKVRRTNFKYILTIPNKKTDVCICFMLIILLVLAAGNPTKPAK